MQNSILNNFQAILFYLTVQIYGILNTDNPIESILQRRIIKMKLKRPISLMLLAIVLASTTLPSCGGESDVQESGTTDTTDS